MSSRLGLADIAPSLIVVWAVVGLLALGMVLARLKDGRLPYPLHVAILPWVAMGFMMTVFGVAQAAYDRGCFSLGLYLFTIMAAAVATGLSGRAARVLFREKLKTDAAKPAA